VCVFVCICVYMCVCVCLCVCVCVCMLVMDVILSSRPDQASARKKSPQLIVLTVSLFPFFLLPLSPLPFVLGIIPRPRSPTRTLSLRTHVVGRSRRVAADAAALDYELLREGREETERARARAAALDFDLGLGLRPATSRVPLSERIDAILGRTPVSRAVTTVDGTLDPILDLARVRARTNRRHLVVQLTGRSMRCCRTARQQSPCQVAQKQRRWVQRLSCNECR